MGLCDYGTMGLWDYGTMKQIQTLHGHTGEKMTMKYLEGQEWTTVIEALG